MQLAYELGQSVSQSVNQSVSQVSQSIKIFQVTEVAELLHSPL